MFNSVVKDRDEQVNRLQHLMGDVFSIAKDINVEVKAQNEKVEVLAGNLNEAADNVDRGNEQLDEAKKRKENSNKCYFWCAGILLILVLTSAYSLFT